MISRIRIEQVISLNDKCRNSASLHIYPIRYLKYFCTHRLHIYYVSGGWLDKDARQKVKALRTRISAAHLCDVMSEKNCSLNGHVHYPQLSIEKTPVDIAKKLEVVGTL